MWDCCSANSNITSVCACANLYRSWHCHRLAGLGSKRGVPSTTVTAVTCCVHVPFIVGLRWPKVHCLILACTQCIRCIFFLYCQPCFFFSFFVTINANRCGIDLVQMHNCPRLARMMFTSFYAWNQLFFRQVWKLFVEPGSVQWTFQCDMRSCFHRRFLKRVLCCVRDEESQDRGSYLFPFHAASSWGLQEITPASWTD